jgi:hypothetical protein
MSSVSWTVDGGTGDEAVPVVRAPPPEELGCPSPDSFVLARTASTAVLVQTIRVHSTGCLLDVQWIRRRQDEDESAWNALQEEAMTFLMDYLDDADGLRIGVEPSAAVQLSLGGTGASLRSDEERISGSVALWLTPLPTAGATRLTCSWERYGIPPTGHELDVEAIRGAARNVTSAWEQPACGNGTRA